MKRVVAAYRLPKRWLVHPQSRTIAGVWIPVAPYAALASDCSDVELGDAIVATLPHSVEGIPHPEQSEWSSLTQPRVSASGLRSSRAIDRLGRLVWVSEDVRGIRLVPSNNAGAFGDHGGFHELVSLEIVLNSDASPDAIGAHVRRAESLCQRFGK